MRSVIVTREQATEALDKLGELPFHHLQRRFLEEHGLKFEIKDFDDKSRFTFSREKDDRAFKITYLGDDQDGI